MENILSFLNIKFVMKIKQFITIHNESLNNTKAITTLQIKLTLFDIYINVCCSWNKID